MSRLVFDGADYDLDNPIDISIPLLFGGPQPNAFGVEPASAEAVVAGSLVGDTRKGGSCNFERVTFIPHCNGTHTESVGHITHERISVRDCLKDSFVRAVLISVVPSPAKMAGETYAVEFGDDDWLITRESLQNALALLRNNGEELKFEALIVRTVPNDDAKLERTYDGNPMPPYFSTEAMEFIVRREVKHLLVDLPSIDRLFDEGKLSNHRIFWDVSPEAYETSPKTRHNSTITELIYAPSEVKDGAFVLNLQLAPFAADAAPSRPVIFKEK
jgi:kynurenine formamidase